MNYWHIECYRKNKVVTEIDWNGNYNNLVKMLRNKMIIYSTSSSRNDTVVHYLNNYDYITINGDFYYELLEDEDEIPEIVEEEPKKEGKRFKTNIIVEDKDGNKKEMLIDLGNGLQRGEYFIRKNDKWYVHKEIEQDEDMFKWLEGEVEEL